MRTYAESCLELHTTIWQVSLVAVDLSSCGEGSWLLMHFCLLSRSILTMIAHPRQLFKIFLMTCQHSTFKNNDDFHSFTRETKRSLMQGSMQQRLIISVLMFFTIVFIIRIYLFQSHHSTASILATDVSPRGVEDRLTSVAKTADVENCD